MTRAARRRVCGGARMPGRRFARMRAGLAAAGGLAIVACAEPPASQSVRLLAMGTSVDITVAGASDTRFEAALDQIEPFLADFGRDFYAWGSGELAELNAALAAGQAFEASPAMVELLLTAQRLSAASTGTFEPAVAALIEAWGFHDANGPPPAEPAAETIAAWLATNPGIRSLRVDGQRVSAPAALQLDLGGIAKGRAVDAVVEQLQAAGIDNALINAGGDLRVIGEPPGRQWRIGVQSPRSDATVGTITLGSGEAAFTSGDYERFFDTDAGRMHHLLDPATGYPASHTQAVTVLAGNGTLADAAATAIFVAGPARWRAVADDLGVDDVLRVDGDGRIEATAAMRDRLQASPEYESDILVARP